MQCVDKLASLIDHPCWACEIWRLRKSEVTVSHGGFLPCSKAWRKAFFRGSRCKRARVHCYQYFLLLFFFLPYCEMGAAQDAHISAMEYQIKAAFLYKFCLYTDWPVAAFSRPDSPFVFGVLGPDSFVAELNTIVKNKTIGKRPVLIRAISGENDLNGVHALFLARTQQRLLPSVRTAAIGFPMLIVTESEGSLGDGATINFTLKNNRVSFEVALDNAQQHGLHLSAKLLEVASNVHLAADR